MFFKVEAGILCKEDRDVNKEIVGNVNAALVKLSGVGGNVNKLRQTVCDGVSDAVVIPNMKSHVLHVASALGVSRKRIDAAIERRSENDKNGKWLVHLCSRKSGGGNHVSPETCKAAVDYWDSATRALPTLKDNKHQARYKDRNAGLFHYHTKQLQDRCDREM